MFRSLLKSKIHRATVNEANLNYEGSVTIPPDLLDASDILPFESVEVWNITNGNRFQTYTIKGKERSRNICINGAAAHLCSPGDLVIIASFAYYQEENITNYNPKVVFVNDKNEIKSIEPEIPGPDLRII